MKTYYNKQFSLVPHSRRKTIYFYQCSFPDTLVAEIPPPNLLFHMCNNLPKEIVVPEGKMLERVTFLCRPDQSLPKFKSRSLAIFDSVPLIEGPVDCEELIVSHTKPSLEYLQYFKRIKRLVVGYGSCFPEMEKVVAYLLKIPIVSIFWNELTIEAVKQLLYHPTLELLQLQGDQYHEEIVEMLPQSPLPKYEFTEKAFITLGGCDIDPAITVTNPSIPKRRREMVGILTILAFCCC